ncbi:hypothetical protein LEP1GSC137_2901 [Leptospira borgpetersenii str. Noumea 25]|uniref:Uncharacterized protein n=2 Tax=Leptospira borgpetersenii TaxID=174 RepID=A0A0S2IVV1_LEPBO|nr:hypothetical protein LBBP_03563 [Leptospira borgpetersenii serovar Ballum]EKQ99426.1 hypothetical protein LEP1GSC121_1752 [Leptospira borgpetersenii serovar Castellonis str. 200801910]EMO11441.1 hypothetical protein LEP1GSC137_2901 [Leptospira borgpetersenii str. Noumea 25]
MELGNFRLYGSFRETRKQSRVVFWKEFLKSRGILVRNGVYLLILKDQEERFLVNFDSSPLQKFWKKI